MPENVTVPFPVQIEIGMICQIDHCRGVRLCRKNQGKFIVFRPFISGYDLHVSRISHLSVFREIHEFHSPFVFTAFPYLVLETFRTSVKMVGTIVYWKFIFFPVKRKMSACNPVRISSGHFSETRPVTEITQRILVPQSHISHFPFLVRDCHGDDTGSDFRKFDVCTG